MMIPTVNCYLALEAGGASGDPHIDDTVLLLGFEGADGSTTITDESPSARGNASIGGNAQIDTAQAKFGSSALLLDGNGDYAEYANGGDFQFTTATQFTIEAWVRFNSLAGFQAIASAWTNSFDNRCWVFDFPGSANNVLRFAYSTTGMNTVAVQGAWAPSTGVWYHLATDYDATNKLRLYANGVMVGSAASVPSFHNTAPALRVGAVQGANFFNGWIDELRITRGVARYASDGGFSVPTAAFPRG